MAESFQERRRRELGLSGSAPSKEGDISFQQKRMMELGMVPGSRQTSQLPSTSELVNSGTLPPLDFRKSSLMRDVQSTPNEPSPREKRRAERDAQDPTNPILDFIKDNTVDRFADVIDWARYETAPGRFLDRLGQAAGKVSGLKPAEEASTGNRIADTAADVVGSIAGYFVNPGALTQGPTAVYRAVEPLTTRLSSRLPNLGSNLANRAASEAIQEGITGAAYAAPRALIQGENDLGEIGKSIAIEGALGAVGGAVAPVVAPAVRGLARATNERVITPLRETVQEAGERITGGGRLGISPFSRARAYDNLRTDTKSQLTTKTRKEPSTLGTKLSEAYSKLVDDLQRINTFEKFTERVLGRKLAPSERPYMQALNTRGSDVIARQILVDNMVDSTGQVAGKSLRNILGQLPKGKFVDFEDYLINRHAITRAGRGEKVFRDELNWTPEVGAQKIAQYEAQNPEFKQIADELYEFQRNMVNKWLVDTGLISKETADQWFEQNPFYVPNKRFFSELEKRSGGTTRARGGFADQSAPVRNYSKTGSQRQIISPIESIIENVDAFVKAAKRNQVMQTLIRNIERDPEAFADWAEIVKQPKKLDDIRNIQLDSEGGLEEVLARFSEDFDKAMQRTKLDKDNIIRGIVDGQPVHVKINDKQLLEALTSLGPEGQNWLLDKVGQLTRMFKVLTTGANPIFGLTRNIFRDIPQAYIMSKTTNNPATFTRDLMAAFFDIARNGEMYRAFKNVGGGHSSAIAADRNLLAQSKRQILPQSGTRNLLPRAFNILENFMNVIESAPRLAEFKRVQKIGGDDAFMKALYEAQDLTTNFKRRGSIGRQLDQVFPYFNAAIQGLDKLVRTFKDDPAKAFVKAFLALTVPTVALYAINRDDPNYQQLSDNIKDNFFLIPKGDGTFIRIAKPRELGTLFSDLPERLMRQFADQDPQAFKRFADQIRTAFSVPGVEGILKPGSLTERIGGVIGDTIAGPVVDVMRNEDFAGRPIVPGYLERLPPALQYDERTSEPAKAIGRALNTSPKQLDFLVRQYGGVLGQIGIPLTTQGAGGGPLRRIGETLERQVTADPLYSTDIVNDFYKRKEELDQAREVFKQTGEQNKNFNEGLRSLFDRTSDRISDIRKQIRGVQANKTLSPDEKERRLRDLQQMINTLAQNALQASNQRRESR